MLERTEIKVASVCLTGSSCGADNTTPQYSSDPWKAGRAISLGNEVRSSVRGTDAPLGSSVLVSFGMKAAAHMSLSTIWISFDLGIRGDYEGLYAWLDQHNAKECSDSLALVSYEHSGSMLDALKEDLGNAVDTNKRTRMYVIYRDDKTKKMKGHFLFGGRRAPPWTGTWGARQEEDDES